MQEYKNSKQINVNKCKGNKWNEKETNEKGMKNS